MLQQEQPGVERRLRGVLEELATACSKYVNHSHNKSGGSTGRSKLDKERLRLCQREVVRIKIVLILLIYKTAAAGTLSFD